MTTSLRRLQLKGADREKAKSRAAELYATGCSIKSVAAELDRSYGGTRALLLEAGVALRARGGRRAAA
ncbi:helix-turn-helix domain-containing protein [Streptomyces sp. NBC_00566]|uniref:helix-turn-helix domain-containing protein n=1 Tax=Streptomyces sp. NBC_00566 TaxID=2975778 RepID=UPI002E80FB14|nr:helix-turn-helix domain-containing protein [Streptomyces sp. NBC_00566]WUB88229.1 helix-turn-helix domain-containing protein [Streptomyces sp. NBC_00566]